MRKAPLSSRRPGEEEAKRFINTFLLEELGEEPSFRMIEDGDESCGHKCGWAFWIAEDDTTSYLIRDPHDGRLMINWMGTMWEPSGNH